MTEIPPLPPRQLPNDTDPQRARSASKAGTGRSYPLLIGPDERPGSDYFEDRSPVTGEVVGVFQTASQQDLVDAVRSARAAWLDWRYTPIAERAAILERAAASLTSRVGELAALLSLEIGKTPQEASYDIQETVDVIHYYADQTRRANGFVIHAAAPAGGDRSLDLLKPYGVWLVISPFNFPMALAGGPASAALMAGNTVVIKPSSEAPAMAFAFAAALREAGLPRGALSVVTGSGSLVSTDLVRHGLAGVTFTGSYEVGQRIRKKFLASGVRVIAEMGGKNPSIVTSSADLEDAVAGVSKSAFGFAGQKCSANSRVYVDRTVYEPFVQQLALAADDMVVGDPRVKGTAFGPVINSTAVERYRTAVRAARREGTIAAGGSVPQDPDLPHGHFVRPTVISQLALSSPLFRRELFLPIIAVAPVSSLKEALILANDTPFGLTAGIFTGREDEERMFLDEIEAGLVYVNRRAGATTGARVNVQTFGGWKGSGASGFNAYGPYYLQQYMREQNQTFG